MNVLPKVSIIIVTFNNETCIEACLDSLLETRYPNLEIIIGDNGSSDTTVAILEQYAEKNAHIFFRTFEKNVGFGSACNRLSWFARGRFFVFLNPDTEVATDWILQLLPQALLHPRLLLQPLLLRWKTEIIDNAGGAYVFPGFGFGIDRKQPHSLSNKQIPYQVDYVNATCLWIERSFFRHLGGFDTSFEFFYEDVDLCLRAKRYGGVSMVVPRSIVYHHRGVSFVSKIMSQRYHSQINRLKIALRHTSFVHVLCMLVTVFLSSTLAQSWKVIKQVLNLYIERVFNWYRLQELVRVYSRHTRGRNIHTWLDLGCGNGQLVNQVRQSGIAAIGVDSHMGIDIEQVQFTKKVDVITLFHVLEHLEDPKAFLKKVHNWLQPNGMLVLELPLIGSMSERWLGKQYFIHYDPTHMQFLSQSQLKKMLAETNWLILGNGITWHQFPLHVITASFKENFLKGVCSLFLWLPYKLASVFGYNTEIIRLYLKKS